MIRPKSFKEKKREKNAQYDAWVLGCQVKHQSPQPPTDQFEPDHVSNRTLHFSIKTARYCTARTNGSPLAFRLSPQFLERQFGRTAAGFVHIAYRTCDWLGDEAPNGCSPAPTNQRAHPTSKASIFPHKITSIRNFSLCNRHRYPSMVQFVFTPWRDRAELLRVREQLYPAFATTTSSPTTANTTTPTPWWSSAEELQAVEKALARVFMWVHRGGCPHVVESTALLMSAIVFDARGGHDAVAVAAVTAGYLVGFTR